MGKLWRAHHRPGFFGRRRDSIVAQLNEKHGPEGWKLAWLVPIQGGPNTEQRYAGQIKGHQAFDFAAACSRFYEQAYYELFKRRADYLDHVTAFMECYDNAETNVQSGLDYTKQEAYSTHIQDIAIRNVLHRLGRPFRGTRKELLQVRGKDTEGFRYNPGNIAFHQKELITQPSLAPAWAKAGSVEDFWQSNKWVLVAEDDGVIELE